MADVSAPVYKITKAFWSWLCPHPLCYVICRVGSETSVCALQMDIAGFMMQMM